MCVCCCSEINLVVSMRNLIVLEDNVFGCVNSFTSQCVPCDFSCSVLWSHPSTSELAPCSMVAARDPTQRDTEAESAVITIRLYLCVFFDVRD